MIKVFVEVALVFVSIVFSVATLVGGHLLALLWIFLNVMYSLRVLFLIRDKNDLRREVDRQKKELEDWDSLSLNFGLEPIIIRHVRQQIGEAAIGLGQSFRKLIQLQKAAAGDFNPRAVEDFEMGVESIKRELSINADSIKMEKDIFQRKHAVAQKVLGQMDVPTLEKYKDYERWAPEKKEPGSIKADSVNDLGSRIC